MNKQVRFFLGSLLFWISTVSHPQNVEIQLSGAKRFTTLIVETAYPFSIESYKPHRPFLLTGINHTQASPESTIVEMFASMRNGDWNWNSSLWTPDSLKKMNARDAATGRGPADWIKLWQKNSNREYRLLNRIEYGRYVLIEYEGKDAGGNVYRDTMALEKLGSKWFLTQELAADPILTHWNSTTGRIQVAPSTLFNK